MRKLTTEQFITKAKLVHGDKYDYHKVSYINSRTPVIIICSIHGEFKQAPSDHLGRAGCQKCGGSSKLSTEEFIIKAKEIHGDKYDYSKTIYLNTKTKVTIICPTHGEFQQSPSDHLSNKSCRECGNLQISKLKKSSTEEFIIKSNFKHFNKYCYDKVNYIDDKTKVTIICPVHGEFEQIPTSHKQGNGCPGCAGTRKPNIIGIVDRANKIHMNKYDYTKAVYSNHYSKIVITCPIHGDFEQTAYHHLSGCGCPSCAITGFDKNKPAILYYLKITTEDNRILYKIGITNRTVNERFNLTDLNKIEIVKQKLYEVGQDALDWETRLKRMYKEYQYKGPDILSSGNTELFTEDIIELYLSQYRMD